MALYKGTKQIAGLPGTSQGGSGGHIIQDQLESKEQRENLKFEGAEVLDDETNNATIIRTPSFIPTGSSSDVKPLAGDMLPVGTILIYGGTLDAIEEGYLPCLGGEYSRTLFSDLFKTIGTAYGEGDHITTFNVPNLGGRTPVGLDENDEDFNTLGGTLGEKTHELTVNEMPTHSHHVVSNITHSDGIQVHGEILNAGIFAGDGRQRFVSNCAATGGSQSHNNIQPSLIVNYIIKAYQKSIVTTTSTNTLDGDETDKVPTVHAVNNALKDVHTNEIVVYDETKVTDDTQIFFGQDGLTNFGSEVVNSLNGDEVNRAPSVHTIKEALNSYQGKGTILWTNSKPTSDCAEQNVELTTNDFDMFYVLAKTWKGNSSLAISSVTPRQFTSMAFYAESGVNYYRGFSISNEGIMHIGATSNNAFVVPICVIGYKTGLFNQGGAQ